MARIRPFEKNKTRPKYPSHVDIIDSLFLFSICVYTFTIIPKKIFPNTSCLDILNIMKPQAPKQTINANDFPHRAAFPAAQVISFGWPHLEEEIESTWSSRGCGGCWRSWSYEAAISDHQIHQLTMNQPQMSG